MKALGTRAFTALFFALVALVLLFSDKGQIAGDGVVRWRALVALASEGRLTADRYSIEMPLLALPLWTAGDAVARAAGETGPARLETIGRVVQRFNKLVAFAIAVWLFRRLRRLGLGAEGAAAGVLVLLFASLLVPHAKDFYGECLWTFFACVAVGLLAEGSARSARGDAALAAATALAVPLNPLLAPVLGATAAVLAVTAAAPERPAAWRGAALATLGAAAGLGLALAENALRRGSALDFGYAGEGFTTPFFTGVAGQLVSPARGAVFYLPAFFLGFVLAARGPAGAVRRFAVAGCVFGTLLVAAYAKWHAWHGMTYWGPRFLLPLSVLGAAFVALSVAAARPAGRAAQAAIGLLVLLSYATYKVGVGIGVGPLRECLLEDAARASCYWDPARLPLASWLSRDGLGAMADHRSTVVEPVALALFGALVLVTARAKRPPATSRRAPECR